MTMAELTGKPISELQSYETLPNDALIPMAASGTSASITGQKLKSSIVGDVTNDVTALKGKTKISLFNSVTDLGLTSGSATITSAYEALPNNSLLITRSQEFTSSETPSIGAVEMCNAGDLTRGWIEFHGKDNGDYRMVLNSSGQPSGEWKNISASASATVTCYNSTSFTVWRVGSVVQIRFWQTVFSADAIANNSIVNYVIPSGFRPTETVFVSMPNIAANNARLELRSTGQIYYYGSQPLIAGASVYATSIYLAD
jgi:hypothetical protein